MSLLMAISASAEEYLMSVCGIMVDTEVQDMTQALTDAGFLKSGKVSIKIYESTGNATLTLDNAVLENADQWFGTIAVGRTADIYNRKSITGLKIEIIGNCELNNTAGGGKGISVTAPEENDDKLRVDFIGPGTLKSSTLGVDNISKFIFFLAGPRLEFNGGAYGIMSTKNVVFEYNIQCGELKATGNLYACYHENLESEFYTLPAHKVYYKTPFTFREDNGHMSMYNGSSLVKSIVVGNDFYDIWIDNVQLTNDPKQFDGVGYDESTKTLMLNNASLNENSSNYFKSIVFDSKVQGLIINLEGDNYISAPSGLALRLTESNARLTGSGTLHITNSNGACVQLRASTLSIADDVKLYAQNQGEFYTITGRTDTSTGVGGSISMEDNAYMKVSNPGNNALGAFNNLQSIDLASGIEVLSPEGGVFDSYYGAIVKDNAVATSVEIGVPTYNLTVNGNPVTGINRDNILGDHTLSYNPVNKTLTMENMHLNSTMTSGVVISSDIDGLTVDVKGNNYIIADNASAIAFNGASTSMVGTGSLKIEAVNGIRTSDALSIGLKNLDVSATRYALFGFDNETTHKCDLTFAKENNSVTLQGGVACLQGFETVTFAEHDYVDYGIAAPEGAYIQNGTAYDAYNNILKDSRLVIGNKEEAGSAFNLWILGEKITPEMCDHLEQYLDFDGDGMPDGEEVDAGDAKITYNPDTKTLTLANLNYNSKRRAYVIETAVEGLTINVEGENMIRSSNHAAILTGNSTTITGNGSLELVSDKYCAIETYHSKLLNININGGVNLTARGVYAIWGHGALGLNISGENTVVNLLGSTYAAIGLTELNLNDGLEIVVPDYGEFYEGIIVDADHQPVAEAIICKSYGLSLTDVKVTPLNAGDILGDGKASYNPETSVLTLNGVNIEHCESGVALSSSHDKDLTIDLKGDNLFNMSINNDSNYDYGLCLYNDHTITIAGKGKLMINADETARLYRGAKLVIADGAVIEALARTFGISGFQSKAETLTIDNATLKITTDNGYPLYGLQEVNLNACHFFLPEGGYYDTRRGEVRSAAGKATMIVIEPDKQTIYGDVNGDGVVNVGDVGEIYAVMLGTDLTYADNADVDGSGIVNVGDVSEVYKVMLSNQQ